MPITSRLVNNNGEQSLTVFIPGEAEPLVLTQAHPNFGSIVEAVSGAAQPSTEALYELYHPIRTVAARFERLGERVTVKDERIYFDGDEVHNSLTGQIVRFLDEGVENWKPLVRFFEKVQLNPSQHSRTQLYDWLTAQDGSVTITDEGNIIAYKGVGSDGKGGFQSIHRGRAIVDGVEVIGNIPNAVGSLVEMPRSEVRDSPNQHCSYGLHVGTYDYAKSWGSGGAMLLVEVSPTDFVSVPKDGAGEKARVCRYRVLEVIDGALAQPLYASDFSGADEDGFFDDFDLDDEIGWHEFGQGDGLDLSGPLS